MKYSRKCPVSLKNILKLHVSVTGLMVFVGLWGMPNRPVIAQVTVSLEKIAVSAGDQLYKPDYRSIIPKGANLDQLNPNYTPPEELNYYVRAQNAELDIYRNIMADISIGLPKLTYDPNFLLCVGINGFKTPYYALLGSWQNQDSSPTLPEDIVVNDTTDITILSSDVIRRQIFYQRKYYGMTVGFGLSTNPDKQFKISARCYLNYMFTPKLEVSDYVAEYHSSLYYTSNWTIYDQADLTNEQTSNFTLGSGSMGTLSFPIRLDWRIFNNDALGRINLMVQGSPGYRIVHDPILEEPMSFLMTFDAGVSVYLNKSWKPKSLETMN